MKRNLFLIGFIALIAVIGILMTGFKNDDGIGLNLYADYSSYVELTVNRASSSGGSFNMRDFKVTVDETPANIDTIQYYPDGNIIIINLYFNSPRVQAGTGYAVKVVYTGSAVAPFTCENTVTCQEAR